MQAAFPHPLSSINYDTQKHPSPLVGAPPHAFVLAGTYRIHYQPNHHVLVYRTVLAFFAALHGFVGRNGGCCGAAAALALGGCRIGRRAVAVLAIGQPCGIHRRAAAESAVVQREFG